MTAQLKNNAAGYLAADISASDTGILLGSGEGSAFPTLTGAQYFYATLVSAAGTLEVVKVTARVGDALTVVRAQEGTIANGFATGARVELRVTAASILDHSVPTAHSFTGDGTTVNYTLTRVPYSTTTIDVFIDGLCQYGSAYSVAGTTLTFAEAPPLNSKIYVLVR